MPYPNEHACRVRDPGDFRKGSFRRVRRKSGARPLDAIMGRLAEDGSAMVLQSYRYPSEDWTASQARRHCRDHEGALFEQSKRAIDCEPCSRGEPMTEQRHRREAVLERQESPTQGAYRATIFVNERARQGPDLDVEGLQLENYMRNPVVLWSHDMSGKTESAGLPIGRTNRMTNTDGKIEVDFEFLAEDPFADRVRNAWDKGFLQAASVSWLPLESEESKDGHQRDVRSDLLEWSIVSVPSDPDAVRQAHSRMMEGLLTERVDDEDVWSGFDARDAFHKYLVDNNIDEKIRQRQEEEGEEEAPTEETPGSCWEAGNPNCGIRQALDAAAEEEPEEASADEERLLSIVQGINQKLRGA